MSSDDDSAAAALPVVVEKCCASCGTAAIDDVKLKPCPHCDLVEYCSDECQQEHRQKHEVACAERTAELYDRILFKQPESTHMGDCPICFLPMPFDGKKSKIQSCCGTVLCCGCVHANLLLGQKEDRCPFCRHLTPETEKESEKLAIERAKLNDPVALAGLSEFNCERGDYESTIYYLTRAVALGDPDAMFNLSLMYHAGELVEKDSDKGRALLEKAAIAGHPEARYNLGYIEMENGRFDRAVAHLIIAANLGEDRAIQSLKHCYKEGFVNKEDYAAALRAYQAAVDAMKSPQREAADEFYNISE